MPCLDGIRAIAMLFVVSLHLLLLNMSINPGWDNVAVAYHLSRFFGAGHFSVDTFFILSAMLAAKKMFQEIYVES